MGEVWITRDLSLERSVATKVLRPELAGDDRFLAYLRTEARTSAPLAHPNIAALYDYGEDDDGAGYLVMELVAGEPLSDILAREQVLPPEELLPILAQAARALHAAHVGGVIHRDIKPSNILITPDGRVKITDFGISVGTGQRATTPRGTVLGTVHYISPEQALGRDASPSSDLYSLGVVAYEAAVGRRPFTGPSVVDVAHAHVNEPVPPLPEHLPPQLRDVIQRMLAKHPERRPRSAASLARALERIAKELELSRPHDEAAPAPIGPEHLGHGADWADEARAQEPAVETVRMDEGDLVHGLAGDLVRSGAVPAPAQVPDVGGGQAMAILAPPAAGAPLPATRGRARHRLPRRRSALPWLWLLVLAALTITSVLGLAAYRLAGSVVSSRGDGTVLRQQLADRPSATVGDGGRAAANAQRHLTDLEDGSW
jgi:serine/threonine-protein kinase